MKTQRIFTLITLTLLSSCQPRHTDPKPDLVITNFSISPPTPESEKNVQAALTVQNLGKGDAGRFTTRWRPFDTHPGFLQDISGLSSNESKTVAFDFAYPSAGAFNSEATVDAQSAIDESNEANNTSFRAVNVIPPSKPDLWIKDFMLDPPEAEAGKTVRATLIVENAGTGSAGNFVVMWRPYAGHTGMTKPVLGLSAHQSSALIFEFAYSNSGNFQTEAIADANQQVAETDEANSRVQGITVRPGDPETMAYEIRVKTGSINYGGTDANVYIVLWGEKGKSNEYELDNAENNFEKNKTDIFAFRTKYLGPLAKVRIRHDNSGDDAGWFLDYIEVTEKEGNNLCWRFDCFRWLAKDADDGQIERELAAKKCGTANN